MFEIVCVLIGMLIVLGVATGSALLWIPLVLGAIGLGLSLDAAIAFALVVVGLLAAVVVWAVRDALVRPLG